MWKQLSQSPVEKRKHWLHGGMTTGDCVTFPDSQSVGNTREKGYSLAFACLGQSPLKSRGVSVLHRLGLKGLNEADFVLYLDQFMIIEMFKILKECSVCMDFSLPIRCTCTCQPQMRRRGL